MPCYYVFNERGFDSATSALHTTAGALKQMCDTRTLAECHYKNYHALIGMNECVKLLRKEAGLKSEYRFHQ